MNVSIYPATKYANALTKAQEVLDASGFFDEVTLSDGAVTCTRDGNTLATVRLTQTTFVATFGSLMNISEGNLASFIIASTSKAVFVSFLSSTATAMTFSVVFTKSKTNKLMCCYNQAYQRNLKAYAEDTTNTQSGISSAPVTSNAYYTTLVPICVATGSDDLVSTAEDLFLFHDRLSSIPRGSFSSIEIDGQKYMTDGDLCVTDDE